MFIQYRFFRINMNIIIIAICLLLLLAYLFDITSSRTRIPSVILFLLLGWSVRQGINAFDLSIPDMNDWLPVFGTIGLILIVLEGSLELKLGSDKSGLIRQSAILSLIPLLLLMAGAGWYLHYITGAGLKDSFTNIVPLCIISSAIAIPSAASLASREKEFVIYESSLSDIFGVLIFNFLALNEVITAISFGSLLLEILVMVIISVAATLLLTYFLQTIEHHIKFAPIILMVILIYYTSKYFHLPGLIFILLFGLVLGNTQKLRRLKQLEQFDFERLETEVHKFKEIATEGAFLIRAMFFLIFGFLIETADVLNSNTLLWSAGITVSIYALRALMLWITGTAISPLIFIAPRGLITILLFISIVPEQQISLVNRSMIIQVILFTAIIMMLGLMSSGNGERKNAGT